MIGFLVFVCVVVLVLINVPIAVALCIASVAAMLATQGVASLPNVPLALYQGATSFPLIAIPLFILAAAIMNTSGISHRLIDFCQALVGWMRGALAQVNVLSHMFFAEISGSAVAGVAATASIIMPAMKKRGYPGPFTAAVTSSTATLAIIIPPSIPMILYAVMAGTSVVQMFVAGIVPGLLAGFGMMGLCYWYAVRYNWPVEEIFQWGKLWRAFKEAFWALTLPVIILGGIFGGVVTATEGAALAVVAALLVGGLVYRELDWARLREAIIDGTVQTGTVMLLVAASALLGLYLTEVQLPQRIAAAMLSITSEKWAILAILNVFFLIIGMFLHSAAAIVLVVPIVMPAVTAAGIDPIHFGVIVTLNLAIGQQTPPVASVLLLTCSIAKESVWDVTTREHPIHRRAPGHTSADHLRTRRHAGSGGPVLPLVDGRNHPRRTRRTDRDRRPQPCRQAQCADQADVAGAGRCGARAVGQRRCALHRDPWCRRAGVFARQRHLGVLNGAFKQGAGARVRQGYACHRAGAGRMPPSAGGADPRHLRRRRSGDRCAVRPAHLRDVEPLRRTDQESRTGDGLCRDGAAGATGRSQRRARDPARGTHLRRRGSEGQRVSSRASLPDDQVAAEARATAERIAEGAPLVARWHKKFARRLAEGEPADSAQELDECFDCFDTEDFRIGYAAFLAKKKPKFDGR